MIRQSIINGVDPEEFCDLLDISTEELFEAFTELIETSLDKFDHLFTEGDSDDD